MLQRTIAKGHSVCPYVRTPYVTVVINAQTVRDIEMRFTLHDRVMFLFFDAKFLSHEFRYSARATVLKRGAPVDRENMTNNLQ